MQGELANSTQSSSLEVRIETKSRELWGNNTINCSNVGTSMVTVVLFIIPGLQKRQLLWSNCNAPRWYWVVFCCSRFVWNFFRLENEHLNNCGEFRAVRDISVAPLNADDQTLLEQMMDLEDGVRNRQKTKFWKRAYSISMRKPLYVLKLRRPISSRSNRACIFKMAQHCYVIMSMQCNLTRDWCLPQLKLLSNKEERKKIAKY